MPLPASRSGVDAEELSGHDARVLRSLVLCLLLGACSTAASLPEEAAATRAEAAVASCVAAAASWGWTKLGPVRGLPEPAQAGDGAFAPAALVHEGVLHLWYTQKTGSRHTLVHGTSLDGGETFGALEEASGLGADHLNAYPTVWREDGAFKLIYGSGSFKVATSKDGVRFTLAPAPVLRASFDATRFDAFSVLYPSRIADVSGDVLFFSGYDGQRLRIGRAVAQTDGTFAVDPPRPVVDLGVASDFDNSAVAQPHVQRAFGRWWMWFGGYDTSLSNPGPYRIGSASSADGITWEKQGVAVDLAPSGSDAWSTRDPSLVPVAGTWSMFYAGLGDDGRYRLHRAASTVCSSSR